MKFPFNVYFHPVAEAEYLESIEWYENALPGLGEGFMLEIKAVLRHIASQPNSFPKKKGSLREAALKKFPFIIIYKPDLILKQIIVLSVFHTSRNPKKKNKR